VEEFTNTLVKSLDPFCEDPHEFLMAINAKDDIMTDAEKKNLLDIFCSIRREVRTFVKHRLVNDIKKDDGLLEAIASQLDDEDKRKEKERIENIRVMKKEADDNKYFKFIETYFVKDYDSVINMSAIDLHLNGIPIGGDYFKFMERNKYPYSDYSLRLASNCGSELISEQVLSKYSEELYKSQVERNKLKSVVRKSEKLCDVYGTYRKRMERKIRMFGSFDGMEENSSASFLIGYRCEYMPKYTTMTLEEMNKNFTEWKYDDDDDES
jgi:hypothetical protein